MPKAIITKLDLGMDLRNTASEIAPGFTQESVGLDFHVPGQITPMRTDVLTQTLGATIQWAQIVYLQNVQYLFVTTSSGLTVIYGSTTTLIDGSFTGKFKILPINEQYVVLSNATKVKKWFPGGYVIDPVTGASTLAAAWSSTRAWGLNTPSAAPTLALAALTTKLIDGFDSLTGWVKAGGGALGAITLDTVDKIQGTGSINLAASANTSISMTKPVTLNLSEFTTVGDLGTGFIDVWFLATDLTAVSSLHVMFSCSAYADFTTDWYQADITINEVASKNLTYAHGGTVDVPIGLTSIPVTLSGTTPTFAYDASQDLIDWIGIPHSKTKKQDIVKYETFKFSDAPINYKQVVVVTKTKRKTTTTSGEWMQFQFQISEFVRFGSTSGRDWSTITAIQIKYDAGANGGSVNVDSLNLLGGGYPFGNYWFAVAFENAFGNYGPYTNFAGPIDAEGVQITLTNIPVDTDPQTVRRRIAVIGGSLTDPMVFWIDDNTTTTYTYNLQDVSFSIIETEFNLDPPSACTDMVVTGNRVFMIQGDSVYYSELEYYEGFPAANYISFPSETLMQLAELPGQYLAARGVTENLIQLLSSDPATWPAMSGAREGAVSSNFLVDLGGGNQIWAAEKYFWQSNDTEYLPKIGFAISDFTQVFGAQAGDLVYLAFTDKGSVTRVLRIDYRLGHPIPHYVENIAPSCIFADTILQQVFYALGTKIYQFDAGTGPTASTKLVIPEQFADNAKIKSWQFINYDLQGGPLNMQLVAERQPAGGTGFGSGGFGGGGFGVGATGLSLPNSFLDGYSVSLPCNMKISLGLILTGTTDFILTLPIKIDYAEVED